MRTAPPMRHGAGVDMSLSEIEVLAGERRAPRAADPFRLTLDGDVSVRGTDWIGAGCAKATGKRRTVHWSDPLWLGALRDWSSVWRPLPLRTIAVRRGGGKGPNGPIYGGGRSITLREDRRCQSP